MFIAALREWNRTVGQDVQDTARALVLHGSQSMAAQDIGYAYLNSLDLADYPRPYRMGSEPRRAVTAVDRPRHVAPVCAHRQPDGHRL